MSPHNAKVLARCSAAHDVALYCANCEMLFCARCAAGHQRTQPYPISTHETVPIVDALAALVCDAYRYGHFGLLASSGTALFGMDLKLQTISYADVLKDTR